LQVQMSHVLYSTCDLNQRAKDSRMQGYVAQ
jgi:hypothetical protein